MDYKRQRSQTAGNIFLDNHIPASFSGQRARSSSLSPQTFKASPQIIEVKINSESEDAFQIPATEVPEYNERRSRSNTLIDDIDLSMYNDVKNDEFSHTTTEEFSLTKNKKSSVENQNVWQQEKDELGKLSGCIAYDSINHQLQVSYSSIIIHHRPFKNFIYHNSDICMEERVTVEIVYAKNSSRRKTSFFKSNSKTFYELVENEDWKIRFKSKHPSQYVLKFTVFPKSSTNHEHLAVGFVFVPLKRLFENIKQGGHLLRTTFDDTIRCHTKEKPQIYGQIHTSLTWNDQINLLEIQLEKIANLSKRNAREKQLFVKIMLYSEKRKIDEYVSDVISKSLSIEQKYFVEIKEEEMKKCFMLIQLHEKHLISSVCVSKALLSPYMQPETNASFDLGEDSYSCWEKLVMFPYKTVSYIGDLYAT